jgi:hypothetical protein
LLAIEPQYVESSSSGAFDQHWNERDVTSPADMRGVCPSGSMS